MPNLGPAVYAAFYGCELAFEVTTSWARHFVRSPDDVARIRLDRFNEYNLPILRHEVQGMTENIFHLDGPGVANHLDTILDVPEINAIQWVQGYGPERPIMQYVPMIRKIQATGKSVVVDLDLPDLEAFMDAVSPEGILPCLNEHDEAVQLDVLNALLKWK